MVYALILFAITYVLMLAFSKYRPYIAIASAAIFIITGMLPLDQIVGAIDFNVLLMIAGTMGLVQLFIDSKMPALLADLVMEKVPNIQMAAVALALLRALFPPLSTTLPPFLWSPPSHWRSAKARHQPCPLYYRHRSVLNLQGAATLVGDTTAIMLGSYANMSFLDFFCLRGQTRYLLRCRAGGPLYLLSSWHGCSGKKRNLFPRGCREPLSPIMFPLFYWWG